MKHSILLYCPRWNYPFTDHQVFLLSKESFSFAEIYLRILLIEDFAVHCWISLHYLIRKYLNFNFVRRNFWILLPAFQEFDLLDFLLELEQTKFQCNHRFSLRNCKNSCIPRMFFSIFHKTKKLHLKLAGLFFCIVCMQYKTFDFCFKYYRLNNSI